MRLVLGVLLALGRPAATQPNKPFSRRLIMTLCSGRDRFFPGEELIYGRLRDQGTAGRRLAGAKPKSAKQKFLDSMLMKNIDPKVAARKAAYLLKVNRTEMCLSSICSIINATQPRPGQYDFAALVDDETPAEIVAAYVRNGVRVIPMQHRVFPPAHYVGNYTRRGPSLDFITPAMTRQMQEAHATASFKLQDATLTAQKATAMGLPTFYHLPYGMYRYWAWGMTQYDEILYIDPDMWLIQPVDYFFNQLRTKVRNRRGKEGRADRRPQLLIKARVIQ